MLPGCTVFVALTLKLHSGLSPCLPFPLVLSILHLFLWFLLPQLLLPKVLESAIPLLIPDTSWCDICRTSVVIVCHLLHLLLSYMIQNSLPLLDLRSRWTQCCTESLCYALDFFSGHCQSDSGFYIPPIRSNVSDIHTHAWTHARTPHRA